MLRGLAAAGADIVMHGLVEGKELQDKTTALHKEFGIRVGHSSANVRKPQEIRRAEGSVALHRLGWCPSQQKCLHPERGQTL